MANKLTKIIAGILIALAVLLGLFALMLGRHNASAPPAAIVASSAPAIYPIVVASGLLLPGQPITADQLKIQRVAAMPAGAFTDPASAVGRVPANPIQPQAPVLESGLTSGLADLLQPGERAVAIKVDEANAVGNRIRPGNFVDVFLSLRRNGAAQPVAVPGAAALVDIPVTQARLLLSKVRVLQFGDAAPDHDVTNNANMGSVRTAILAVPTADIDTLTVAQDNGQLSLALRSPRDGEVASSPVSALPPALASGADASTLAAAGVALAVLSSNATGAPAKQAAPAPVHPHRARQVIVRSTGNGSLEVIRGGQAETVTY